MKTVMEIVNYIRTHALNHRQFKNLIAELDQGFPGDLPLHCPIRRLSKSQVLSRFFQLLDVVKLFMEEKNKNYPELLDLEWIMDLAILVDMLYHLNRLNLNLLGKLKTLPDLVRSIFAFINKPKLFKAHIQKGDLTHFPTLVKAGKSLAPRWISKELDMQHFLRPCKKALCRGCVIYNWKGHRLRSSSTHLILRPTVWKLV